MTLFFKRRVLVFLCFLSLFLGHCARSPYKEFNQGLKNLETGQTTQAKTALVEFVEAKPKNAEGWNQLGIIAFEQEEWDLARNCFRKAYALDRLHPAYPRNLALVYANDKQYDLAEELLDRSLAVDPLNTHSLIALAKVKMLQEKNTEAELLLNRVRKIDPAHKEAQTLLTRLSK